jgi:putative transposase
LKDNAILISIPPEAQVDGRGRALDNIFGERLWRNVKYEDVYPKNYASMPALLMGLAEYFIFYNGGRFHQALGYKTPDQVYRTGDGGGAKSPIILVIKMHFQVKERGSNHLL